MKLLILAAGYATRLYPLTETQPKPLLTVAGRPIIEAVFETLEPIGFDRAYVVSNGRFAGHFEEWAKIFRAARPGLDLVIVNDRSTDEANKLGAIGDLHMVLTSTGLDDDLIVVAGDNLFSERLAGFGEFCRGKQAPVLGVYDVGNLEDVKKYSAITLDGEGRISRFEEKPPAPATTLIGIALYFYPRNTLPLIKQYVAEGNNPDQPGHLVHWLYQRTPVYAWTIPGLWYDIGSRETLDEANRVFSRKPHR